MVENPKEIATEGEAIKFLKLIRQSEYKLLDQMHKTPMRVSLLYLLINSEGHCNLLLKVLNEAHVAQDITIEKFEGIENNITASSHLSFSKEVPVEGKSGGRRRKPPRNKKNNPKKHVIYINASPVRGSEKSRSRVKGVTDKGMILKRDNLVFT
ncbi:hypothetical protein CR513_25841, partial [Mucuna pruriens]